MKSELAFDATSAIASRSAVTRESVVETSVPIGEFVMQCDSKRMSDDASARR